MSTVGDFTVGAAPQNPMVADFNGDGKRDNRDRWPRRALLPPQHHTLTRVSVTLRHRRRPPRLPAAEVTDTPTKLVVMTLRD